MNTDRTIPKVICEKCKEFLQVTLLVNKFNAIEVNCLNCNWLYQTDKDKYIDDFTQIRIPIFKMTE